MASAATTAALTLGDLSRVAAVALVLLASSRPTTGDDAPTPANLPPHVVFLVVDDLGWSDTTIQHGVAGDISTPKLKALADAGIRLSNFYTQPVCSPSRSALMTGRFPFRDGMQHEFTIPAASTAHVPLTTPMLPELLSKAGYATHAIGKWHLGYAAEDFTPTGRGFDTHFGYYQGEVDYYNKTTAIYDTGKYFGSGFDFWFNKDVWKVAAGEYSLTQFTRRGAEIFTEFNAMRNKEGDESKRLFLYLAEQTVHVPLAMARAATADRCAAIKDVWRRIYCSMLVELDDAVGQLTDLLTEFRMYNDTVIFMTTDNGGMVRFQVDNTTGGPLWPASAGSNAPFRGSKATLFEGGLRGTAFVGGGFIPASARGTVYEGLMHLVDFPATVYELVSGGRPGPGMDGIGHWQALTSESGSASMGPAGPESGLRSALPLNVIYDGTRYSAARFGFHYKIIVGEPYADAALDGWRVGGLSPAVKPPHHTLGVPYLFNVTADPEERRELTAANCPQYADLLAEGTALLRGIAEGKNFSEPQPTPLDPRAFPDRHDGVWAPFCELKDC